jgi:hypothetical protein
MPHQRIFDNESIFDVLVRGGSNSEHLISVLQQNNMTFSDTVPIVSKDSFSVVASNSYNFKLSGDQRDLFPLGGYFIFENEKYKITGSSYVAIVGQTFISCDETIFITGETYLVYTTTNGSVRDFSDSISFEATSENIPEVSVIEKEDESSIATINGLDGQSVFDIALMTYGTTEYLIKLLQDSNIDSINTASIYGNTFTYDKNLISDITQFNHRVKNGIIYGTGVNEEVAITETTLLLTESSDYLTTETGDYLIL